MKKMKLLERMRKVKISESIEIGLVKTVAILILLVCFAIGGVASIGIGLAGAKAIDSAPRLLAYACSNTPACVEEMYNHLN